MIWQAVAACMLFGLATSTPPQANKHSTVRKSVFQSDTLTLASALRTVNENHPVLRQARLGLEQAAADLTTARGAYDPILAASWEQKTFDGTRYFDYLKGTATVSTTLGVDLKLSYENTQGKYINPDRRTTGPGLLSFGISVPIGQRWLVDERRTAIVVAREAQRVAEADFASIRNRVLADATRDYARWFEASRRVAIARDGVDMAETRYQFTKTRVSAGEAAPVDTVEAALELQKRTSTLIESEQTLFGVRAQFALHLWNADGQPVQLQQNIVPVFTEPSFEADDEARLMQFVRQHPDVAKSLARMNQSDAQSNLASAQRIPLPALELSTLSTAERFPTPTSSQFGANPDNLKQSASLSLPLFFRKERGRAAGAGARYRQSAVEYARVQQTVRTNITVAQQESRTARRLLELQRAIVDNTAILVRGEDTRFRNGESTLLVMMIRERNLLDERLRQASIELRVLVSWGDLMSLTGQWDAR